VPPALAIMGCGGLERMESGACCVRATVAKVRWLLLPLLLDDDAGPMPPWWWAWGCTSTCQWLRGGASGCVGPSGSDVVETKGGGHATAMAESVRLACC
jgi:hypothetical protein